MVIYFFIPGSGNAKGSGGGSGEVGLPADGTWTDGAANIQSSESVASAIDDVNELLGYLLPQAPQPLASNLIITGLTSGYVANQPNLGPLTAGQLFNSIANGTNIIATTPNTDRFDKADKGVLVVVYNGTDHSSFDLAASFNESLRNTQQSYPPAYSPDNVIRVDSVKCYNNFPSYQVGAASIILQNLLQAGYNIFRLEHRIDTEIQQTNDYEIFVNIGHIPTITSFSVTIDSTNQNFKYLSGIKFYTTGTMFHISADVSDLFNTCYLDNAFTVTSPAITPLNINWNASGTSGYNTPPNYNDSWSVVTTCNINNENSGDNIQFTAIAHNVYGDSSSSTDTLSSYLWDAYNNHSTNTHEFFVDENYRLPSGSYDSVPTNITGQWDSTTVLSNGNLQVINHSLVYPQTDYTSFTHPVQSSGTDYSGFTGSQVYIRAIKGSSPHNSGTIHINGLSESQLGSIVNIHIKLPSKTGWLDLSKPFNASTFTGADGDGCQTSITTSGGELIIGWSSGTYSTGFTNNMYIIRITYLDSAKSVKITELYESAF